MGTVPSSRKPKLGAWKIISLLAVAVLVGILAVKFLQPQPLAVLRGHDRWITCLTFSDDGALLASGGLEGNVIVWDTSSWTIRRVYSFSGGGIGTVCFLSPTSQLAVGSANGLTICDVSTGETTDLENQIGSIQNITAMPGPEEFLVVGTSGVEGWRGTSLIFRHMMDPTLLEGSQAHPVVLKKTQSLVVDHFPLSLVDIKSGKQLGDFSESHRMYWAMAASRKEDLLATGDTGWFVRIWDITQRTELASHREHWWPVQSVAFSPDGRLLASGSYAANLVHLFAGGGPGDVVLWDIAAKRRIARFKPARGAITALAFSPIAPVLAAGSNSDPGEISIWPVPKVP
jgi:WD40 repeat protein